MPLSRAVIEQIEPRGEELAVTVIVPRSSLVLPNGKRRPKGKCLSRLRNVVKGVPANGTDDVSLDRSSRP